MRELLMVPVLFHDAHRKAPGVMNDIPRRNCETMGGNDRWCRHRGTFVIVLPNDVAYIACTRHKRIAEKAHPTLKFLRMGVLFNAREDRPQVSSDTG